MSSLAASARRFVAGDELGKRPVDISVGSFDQGARIWFRSGGGRYLPYKLNFQKELAGVG
jgi:hypothetical protein